MRLYDDLFCTAEMTATLSEETFVVAMLRFEAALSAVLEENEIHPAGTASAIASIEAGSFDRDALMRATASAGNACIPFVKMLTAKVAEKNADAAAYVHWGATSQDVIDTSLMLQMRSGFLLLQRDLQITCEALMTLVEEHRTTVMPGRTWLQQGPPVTLGLKLASWLDGLQRHSRRMEQTSSRVFVLQFGGAVGTLAPLGEKGMAVAESLGRSLGLPVPAMPWHTQRDRMGELAATLGLLAGSLGKIARDVSLLMQTEVDEFLEPTSPGRGGSSTMPHKRNPVYSAVILSAAVRVPGLVSSILSGMVQEHERGLGGWHAEWETLAEILRLTGGALFAVQAIVIGGSAVPASMRRNLGLLQGTTMAEAVSFALAEKIGKHEAHRVLEEVSRRALQSGKTMAAALMEQPEVEKYFNAEEIEHLLAPQNYLGSTHAFIDRVLKNGEPHAKR